MSASVGRPKLLCLCDSPTKQSGFARVAQNLLAQWHRAGLFEQIWVWGIGYSGFPHSIDFLANRIFPASSPSRPAWYHPDNLQRFLHQLQAPEVGGTPGGYTHVWIMQDTFALAGMAEALAAVAQKVGARTLLYFPVDAPLEPAWTRLLARVDVPVAYCEYGLRQARQALRAPIPKETDAESRGRAEAVSRLVALPHGVDRAVYRPLFDRVSGERFGFRDQMFKGQLERDRFLMVNVSQHQRRKGLFQSLEVLAALMALRPELKPALYFHCPEENPDDGTSLRQMALQRGLVPGRDVFFGDSFFVNRHPIAGEATLNQIYNVADLLLSTSYGEGWGLPLTEAMAAGTPVAGPNHTSVADLLSGGRGILFGTLGAEVLPGDNSRVRPRADPDDAATRIVAAVLRQELAGMRDRASRWVHSPELDWKQIAMHWERLFFGDNR